MQLKSFLSGGFSKKMYAFQIYRYFDTAYVVAVWKSCIYSFVLLQ